MFLLQILDKNNNVIRKFELDDKSVKIGRDSNNDLIITDPFDTVSRRHAIIEKVDDTYIVKDLGSLNGTTVNGKQIKSMNLTDGDIIKFGGVIVRFYDAEMLLEEQIKATPGDIFEEDQEEISNMSVIAKIDQELLENNSSKLELKERFQDAIHNKANRREKLLEILLEVSKSITTTFDVDELLNQIMDRLFAIFEISRGTIILLDEETDELIPRVVRRADKDTTLDNLRVSRSIVRRVLDERESILTADAMADGRFSGESIIAQNIRSAMCVPLQGKEKALGVIYIDNLSLSGRFKQEDLEFLTAFANQVAIFIENSYLLSNIQKQMQIRGNLERYLSPSIVNDIITQQKNVSLGGVLREVTILFSDIRGFTPMTEKMTPDETLQMLNEYFSIMTDIIFGYDGTLDKYLGDGLMALWGVPLAIEQGAYKSVFAAVKMMQEVEKLNQYWKESGSKFHIQIGIGIDTGPVIAGNIGSERRMEYTALGDRVNTASRLCSVAKPKEILIATKTYEEIKDKFQTEKLAPVKLKGKEKKVDVYRIIL